MKDSLNLASTLLTLPEPSGDPGSKQYLKDLGLHTFALGAIHSLRRAIELGYSSETWDPSRSADRFSEVRKDARLLEKGKFPQKGAWLAEYYYNSCILRVDVAFERCAQYITGDNRRRDINGWVKLLRAHRPKKSWIKSW